MNADEERIAQIADRMNDEEIDEPAPIWAWDDLDWCIGRLRSLLGGSMESK